MLTSADEGGSRSSRGNGGRHWGFSNPEAVLAVVALTTVTSGVAYEGARLRAEENRLLDKAEAREAHLVDKAEAREAHLALERKRETDKAEAREAHLAFEADLYMYMAQVAGTHDYEPLWGQLQKSGKGQGRNGNAPPGRSLAGVDVPPGDKEKMGGKETTAAGGGM